MATGLLVIGLFLYCPMRALLPVVLMLSNLLQLEFYGLVRKSKPVVWLGLLIGCAYLMGTGLYGFDYGTIVAPICFTLSLPLVAAVVSLVVMFDSSRDDPVASIASTLFGVLYVPFLMSFFLLVVQLTGSGFWGGHSEHVWSRTGLYTLLALVATAKLSDTGGFAFGLAFGKHKMCPSISPKKSWEGLLGSVVFASITMCAFYALSLKFDWAREIPAWGFLSYPTAAAAGGVMAVVATLGDLVESRFKRAAGVKDSSSFMPAGIGGFLDMLDSVMFMPALLFPVLGYHFFLVLFV